MSESTSPVAGTPRRDRQQPGPSRPLSQISGNNIPFTAPVRESSWSGKPNSRPSSVVHDTTDGRAAKRASMTLKSEEDVVPPPTILSLNLNEYASNSAKQATAAPSTHNALDDVTMAATSTASGQASSSKLALRGALGRLDTSEASVGAKKEEAALTPVEKAGDGEAILKDARSSLKPARRISSYAEAARAPPTPTSPTSVTPSQNRPAPIVEFSSSRPPAKAKPSWLRRTTEQSGLSILRSKSKSPLLSDTALPPALPPRNSQSSSISREMPPPPPRKASYADAISSPSRSAFPDATPAGLPPRIPPRNKIGDRIAAFSRSSSSASLASQASTQSTFSQQRLPTSASRVLGNAGSAVQKGWAGIRSRGVGGSLSSLSQLGQSSRRGPPDAMSRSSRERYHTTGGSALTTTPEGPDFADAVLMRIGKEQPGTVFGRELVDAGRDTHVMDANAGDAMEKMRRHCLPAIVVRCVEYLEIWGPKEEGIFRISGRSSHIVRLKKDFDTGADLDMRQCHPGDLDPHAVAGLFKSYLRELPSPLLTSSLTPQFDAYAKKIQGSAPPSVLSLADLDVPDERERDDLDDLLDRLPAANWFLLSEIVKLLDLIPRHVETNRMTLHALMVSLGPSLKVGNGVLSELLKHRTKLFSKPPSENSEEPKTEDAVTDLIDFGTTSIEPPTLGPIATMPLKTGQATTSGVEKPATMPLKTGQATTSGVEKPSSSTADAENAQQRRLPKLSSKPSLTKLFSGSSRNLAAMDDIRPTPSPLVDPEPPRVDLTIAQTSPLPVFSDIPSPPIAELMPPLETTPPPSTESERKKLDDFQYPSGTVQQRSELFGSPTPIADLFVRKSPHAPLLNNRDSGGSSIRTSTSVGELPRQSSDNPATAVRRRGQSGFFSGSSGESRMSFRSAPNTPGNKGSSGSISVKDMIRDMDKKDAGA